MAPVINTVLGAPPKIHPPVSPTPGVRVVLVTPTLMMGGAESQTVSLACGLADMGYSVTVINKCPQYPPCKKYLLGLEEHGVAVVNGELANLGDVVIWWGNSLNYMNKLEAKSIYVGHSSSDASKSNSAAMAPMIDYGVGVCGAATSALRSYGLPCETIWNGVDPVDYPYVGEVGEYFDVLFFGRYVECKNLFSLVESIKYLPPHVRLLLHGYGSLNVDLMSAIQEAGVADRVSLGLVTDFRSASRGKGCIVLPSYYEGFPVALAEAAMAGLPVVATPCGDVGLAFKDGLRGIMCKHDAWSIAHGIFRLVEDPSLAFRISRNARELALRHLTLENMCNSYANVIERVL